MAGKIPQQFIDELLSRVDIVEVIDRRVPLRKAGRDFQARCPFHEEKSPSFTVSPNKQFYHCFGCGAHGSAIGFLMAYEHLDFIEAVKELAKQAGVELPQTEESSERPQGEGLHEILAQAHVFFRRQLKEHPAAATAIEYLKNRGLTGDIAAEFGIGYAPPGWDNLLNALGRTPTQRQQLLTTGMLVPKENDRYYDRFRDRIMFPIRNRRGQVIGFGGRVLSSDETPKYLNSPESPLFHKGRELYGLYEARQALRHIDRLLVVEGYMDVVALAQHGIRNAVATLGTALTPDHVQILFRTTGDVVFCFDGDRAGRAAAWKSLDIVLPEISEGRQARFMFLPEQDDPDSLVRREGADAFQARIANAVSLSEFLFQSLASEVDMSAVDGRARLVELARPKLNRVTNAVYRLMLIAALAERVRMGRDELVRLLEDPATPTAKAKSRLSHREPPRVSAVRQALTLLLNQPSLALAVANPARYRGLQEPGVDLLVEVLELIQRQPQLSCGGILEQWRERPEAKHLARLARNPITTPEEGMASEFVGSLRILDKMRLEHELEQLLRQGQTEGLSSDGKRRLAEILAEKDALTRGIPQIH